MNPLDPFYLIVDSANWIERLVPHGIRLVQLRVKNADKAEIAAQVRRAKKVCADHDCQLIVNDYWQIAIDEGCDVIHLGQEDLESADMEAIRKAGLRVGISTHDHAELARALSFEPDYVALGPVYPTLLKKMPWAPQGLARVTEWKRRCADIPLVAIGGLTPERARKVLAAGADCAAVVTDIIRNTDPETRLAEWLQATRVAR